MNWEKLKCPYFTRVLREELSSALEARGILEELETWEGGIVYRAARTFVEISYYLEFFPRYPLKVVIGFGGNTDENARTRHSIPLWYAIPAGRPDLVYETWQFTNEDELRDVLQRLAVELLDKIAIPLVEDESALNDLVTRFRMDNNLPP